MPVEALELGELALAGVDEGLLVVKEDGREVDREALARAIHTIQRHRQH